MTRTLDELWPQRAEGLPFRTRGEALILASIVDKETGVADERDKVAAVFINRLRRGMRLQADPTVIYGLTEGDGALGRELNRRDWEHDSAYNTYQIEGLPPGRSAIPAGPRSKRCCARPRSTTFTSSPTAAAGTRSPGPWPSTTATSRSGAR